MHGDGPRREFHVFSTASPFVHPNAVYFLRRELRWDLIDGPSEVGHGSTNVVLCQRVPSGPFFDDLTLMVLRVSRDPESRNRFVSFREPGQVFSEPRRTSHAQQ